MQYATTSFADQQQFLKLQKNDDHSGTIKTFNEHMKTNFSNVSPSANKFLKDIYAKNDYPKIAITA